MNLGTEDKKKLTILAVAGTGAIAAAIYMYTQLSTPDEPHAAPIAPVIVSAPRSPVATASQAATASPGPIPRAAVANSASAGNAAGKVGTTASQYDPTLKMEAMLVTESLVYSGSGRNIFSASSAPADVPIPKIQAPVRTTGVVLPVFQPPPGPPPPPPIDLKFFGTVTRADGSRQAFLLHGDDVFLASLGSIVQRRYKVGTISAGTVDVEDLTNNNKQTLPLQRN